MTIAISSVSFDSFKALVAAGCNVLFLDRAEAVMEQSAGKKVKLARTICCICSRKETMEMC